MQWALNLVIFKLLTGIDFLSILCKPALKWMSQYCLDNFSLVEVMTLCPQATSNYLNQCCPSSMMPYGVNPPQTFKMPGIPYLMICIVLGRSRNNMDQKIPIWVNNPQMLLMTWSPSMWAIWALIRTQDPASICSRSKTENKRPKACCEILKRVHYELMNEILWYGNIFHITVPWEWNPPVTGWFSLQRAKRYVALKRFLLLAWSACWKNSLFASDLRG